MNFNYNLKGNEESNLNSNKINLIAINPYINPSTCNNFFKFQSMFPNQIRSINDKYDLLINISYAKPVDQSRESNNIIENNKSSIHNNNFSNTNVGNAIPQGNNQTIEKPISSNNTIPFEDFNKFNISKVESSEINNRELKTTKLIKNPISDFEELGFEEIGKYSYSLAKDQAGCRFLQKKLDETPSLANEIFPKLMDKMIELMNDSFGNYLIQKVLEKLSEDRIRDTLNSVL